MLVLATFTLVIAAKEKAFKNAEINKTGENGNNYKNRDKSENLGTNFAQVLCIQYPITFQEQSILALFDSKSEFNTIHLSFAKELDFSIRLTDVKA